MPKIKLLVACYSTLSRLGLSGLFYGEEDFTIIKAAGSIDDTVRWAKKGSPDILLICSQLLIEDGFGLIARIKKRLKRPRLVVFNSTFTLEQELMLVKDGVAGILGAKTSPPTIIKALRKVNAGEFWLRRELIPSLVAPHSKRNEAAAYEHSNTNLTRREQEVLSQIAAGYNNTEISSKLCISESTVKTHINNTYKKLRVNDRLQATLYAIKHNLLSG